MVAIGLVNSILGILGWEYRKLLTLLVDPHSSFSDDG